MWGSPKTRGTFSGVPIRRMIVFGGLSCDPPILGNYHVHFQEGGAQNAQEALQECFKSLGMPPTEIPAQSSCQEPT